MIALVVYACLAAEPATCSQSVIQLADKPAALSCSSGSTDLLARWVAENPDLIVQDHWCQPAPDATAQGVALADPRILPLDACAVRSRSSAIVWSYRNPGLSSAEECKRLLSN